MVECVSYLVVSISFMIQDDIWVEDVQFRAETMEAYKGQQRIFF